jgi:hypothetical protein
MDPPSSLTPAGLVPRVSSPSGSTGLIDLVGARSGSRSAIPPASRCSGSVARIGIDDQACPETNSPAVRPSGHSGGRTFNTAVGAVPGTELKRPSAGAPSAGWKDRLARTHTAAEPTGQGAKEEADGAQQCGARHRLSRCVGGLRRLLLGLIYCLPILLLVLLNLRASMAAGAWVMPRFGLAPKMRYRTTSHFCISCNFVVAWMSLIVGVSVDAVAAAARTDFRRNRQFVNDVAGRRGPGTAI